MVIDVSLPLCRGRLISFDEGEERWVSFKYERLPNMCYWCGCLNHSDKDCDWWIESDGSLKDEDKEYGPWIRTTAATLNKKFVVRVLGFYEARKKKQQPVGQRGGADTSRVAVGRSKLPVTVEMPQVEIEVDLAEEFNERINFGGVNSASSKIETPKPNLERDSLERNLKEIDEELRKYDINEKIISGDITDPIKAQGVMVNIEFQTEESAGQLKESGSCINVPPRINDHVSPCEVIRGKNPRQKT